MTNTGRYPWHTPVMHTFEFAMSLHEERLRNMEHEQRARRLLTPEISGAGITGRSDHGPGHARPDQAVTRRSSSASVPASR
jgi:hypothetical protein